MLKFKMFDLSIGGATERFYLMMAGTVILGFLGQFTLAAFWGFTLAISFILGVSIKTEKRIAVEKPAQKIVKMKESEEWRKAV